MGLRRRASIVGVLLCALTGAMGLAAGTAWARPGYLPSGSFAPSGGFGSPVGLAVDNSADMSKGDVYVSDRGAEKVEEFSASGSLLAEMSVPGVTLGQMAVDDALGLDEGNAYVAAINTGAVYRFTPGLGAKEQIITGLTEPVAVAIDNAGDMFVAESEGKVLEFNLAGQPVDASGGVVVAGKNIVVETSGGVGGVAVDESGEDLYVRHEDTLKYKLSGNTYVAEAEPFEQEGGCCSVMVAPSGEVFVEQNEFNTQFIFVYDSTGKRLTVVAESASLLQYHPGEMGLNAATGELYVAEGEGKKVWTFEAGERPETPTTEPYSQLEGGLVTMNGTLGAGAQDYYFAYNIGPSCENRPQEQRAPHTEQVAVSGSSAGQKVHAQIDNLQHFSNYSYCLVTTDKYGSAEGATMTLETKQIQPEITEERAPAAVRSARLSGFLNPEGEAATYSFEWGQTTLYGSTTEPLPVIAGESPVEVTTTASNLAPDTEYHFRLVATNSAGTRYGPDVSFITYAPSPPVLPDGRVYELVTPPENTNADAYQPGTWFESPFAVEAAENGEAVEYDAQPTHYGNGSSGSAGGNQYVATHNAQGGWTQQNITPPEASLGSNYGGFTPNLTEGWVWTFARAPVVATATPPGENNGFESGVFTTMYSHKFDESLFVPMSPVVPRRAKEHFRSNFGSYGGAYAGSSADASHVLYQVNEDVLEGDGAVESELAKKTDTELEDEHVRLPPMEAEAEKLIKEYWEGAKAEAKYEEYEAKQAEVEALKAVDSREELYMSVNGSLSLVDILPTGEIAGNAVFGGYGDGTFNFYHDISADGTRVFWTDLEGGRVYVRENGTKTVAVSQGSATFWTASVNGKYAYYTEGASLWRFDTEDEERVELAGSSAVTENGEPVVLGVQGVIGTNEVGEEGAYVYYVSTKAIAGLKNTPGQEPVQGEGHDNVYLIEPDPEHAGRSRVVFVATLLNQDSPDWALNLHFADYQARSAEPTPDGQALMFESHANLTGHPYVDEGSPEIYVYDTSDGSLICASCRPQATEGYEYGVKQNTYAGRWISEDGDQVFFNSRAPLVARDVNGEQDVYEWERDGSGECAEVNGCVYLLTGGIKDVATLIDTSANGSNVFFTTNVKLVPQQASEDIAVYDARVDGVEAVTPPQCTGTGCQGVPTPPPIFATPASFTYNGVGDFPPEEPSVKAPKSTPLTRAQKLQKALTVCRKRAKGKRRTRCEAQARRSRKASRSRKGGK